MRPFVAIVPRYVSPNFITTFRFFSVPIVAWLLITDYYAHGVVLFAISAFSDALDGALARTRGEITAVGKLFDPIADKLLIVTTAFIVIGQFLPLWLFYLILGIEVVTVATAIYAKYFKKVDVQANIFGKIKMVMASFGVLSLLIYAAFWRAEVLVTLAFWLLIFSVFFAAVSLMYNKGV
ncbi:MAG: CDP-alcohol phosphatidyltransferase family protein [Candidatus Taylorbacteria bacterium]|nr:CDP-alcohol phosphatidyltransferase family protein [Candidatus Taylorbacteria bacterium]